jgi:hypothetical protein
MLHGCYLGFELLYRKLGAKLVVGMPFKDIATSDSIFMRKVSVLHDMLHGCYLGFELLYRKLGAKLVVGMPFKDIATSDSIFMRTVRYFAWYMGYFVCY